MKAELHLQNREAWQENAKLWETYEPPIRPSAGDRLIYDLVLSGQPGRAGSRRALVLGDCPEVRDLLAEHEYETTVVANNPNAVIAMNQLLEYMGPKKEKVAIMDWQAMDFADESFDIIVSDWGLNSLEEWRDYTIVLHQVERLLAPSGTFVTRVNVFQPQRKVRSLAQIMNDFSKHPEHKFSYLIEMELYSTLSTYDEDTFQIDLGKFYQEEITRAYHAGKLAFSEWQEFYYPFFKVTLTYPRQESLEQLLKRFFVIAAVRFGGDYLLSDNNPLYICKKINHLPWMT